MLKKILAAVLVVIVILVVLNWYGWLYPMASRVGLGWTVAWMTCEDEENVLKDKYENQLNQLDKDYVQLHSQIDNLKVQLDQYNSKCSAILEVNAVEDSVNDLQQEVETRSALIRQHIKSI